MKLNIGYVQLIVAGMFVTLSGCAGLKDATKAGADSPRQSQAEQQAVTSVKKDDVVITSLTSTKPEMVALEAEGVSADAYGSLDFATGLLAKRIIYFDYDSAEVNNDAKAIIGAHAQYLQANKVARLLLEGHTDERGSREYNTALADRRARTVQQIMVLTGVSREQLELVSYGEEKPAEQGHDEAAWSKNRRVELVYRKE